MTKKCGWCKRADGSHTDRCPYGPEGAKARVAKCRACQKVAPARCARHREKPGPARRGIGRRVADSIHRARMEQRAHSLLVEAEREAGALRGQLAEQESRVRLLRELLGAG